MNGFAALAALLITLGRVSVVILVWLVVFAAMFLGYMTIPLIVLTAFMVVFAAFDLGRAFRRRRAGRRADRAR